MALTDFLAPSRARLRPLRCDEPTASRQDRHESVRLPLALAGITSALVLGAGTEALTYAALDDGGGVAVREVTVTSSEPVAQPGGHSIGDIYERSEPSVVQITVRQSTGSSFGLQQRGAVGSGFVFDRDGHVVTNQHVVGDGGSVSVLFSDGSSFPATVVGTDRSTDLAVLDVDAPASKLQPLVLADSDAVEVGDAVVAMGSPFRPPGNDHQRSRQCARPPERAGLRTATGTRSVDGVEVPAGAT